MIGLVVSAFRFALDPVGFVLDRWRRDRVGGERHEFYRQALVDAEAEEDVFEGEFWCNEHDTFCDHKPPYCTGCGSTHAAEQTCLRWAEAGIPASGADASSVAVSTSPPVPATERPTSELLRDGVTAIGCWLSGRPVPEFPAETADQWWLAIGELTDRADYFEAIEKQQAQ